MSLLLNGTDGVTFNDGSEQWAAASPIGPKNLIINGDMRIAQRGTSQTSITSSGYYTVDRWYMVNDATGTWTQTQDTDVPTGQGFATSVKLACTTADASLSASDGLQIHTRLEGQNLQHLKKGTSSAEKLTVSFWVKSNKTGTYIYELYDQDNARQVSKSYTIDTADTWEKKTITIDSDTTGAFDNDNNLSLYSTFWLAAGSDKSSGTLNTSWASSVTANRVVGQVNLADSTSNYINITGVQLEVGDTATPFEHRPYDMELVRCQRYYEKSWNVGVSVPSTDTGGAVCMICMANSSTTLQNNGVRHNFQHRKRTAPTVTVYPIASTTAGSISYARHSTPRATGTASLTNASEMSIRVGGTGSGLTTGYAVELIFHYTADAEL